MGYGPPVQLPMSLGTPSGLRSPGNPGLPELESLPDTRAPLLAAKPRMKRADTTDFSKAREESARQAAIEMGAAFAFSKAQDKVMKAKAKAKERRAQKMAKKR